MQHNPLANTIQTHIGKNFSQQSVVAPNPTTTSQASPSHFVPAIPSVNGVGSSLNSPQKVSSKNTTSPFQIEITPCSKHLSPIKTLLKLILF